MTMFLVLILIIVLLSETSAMAYSENTKQPHIVLITADDLGWSDVGWRNSNVITPNMDWLANNGVRLEQMYTQPLCAPSRAAMMTGKYPYRLGMQWFTIALTQPKYLPRDEIILPQTLKEAGYSTHLVGKWHLGHCAEDLLATSRGFDSFYGFQRGWLDYYNRTIVTAYDFWKNDKIFYPPEGSYNTDLFTEEAINLIENNNPENPLFLWLSHAAPHFPMQVPQKYKDLYPRETDPDRQTYLGMVSSLDESIGKVVEALWRNNHLQNSVIMFLSDNGGDNTHKASNLPLRGDKGDLWEGGTRVVSFVYSPYLARPGCKHDGMIHIVDWYSTILSLAGLTPDQNVDGVNQWNYINQCRGSGRNEFVYNIDDDVSKASAIRMGDYKLIVGEPVMYREITISSPILPFNPNSTDIRLFNLKDDPSETYNLAYEMPELVEMMKRRLDEYRTLYVPAQNPPRVSTNITEPGGVSRLGWC